MNNLTKCFPKTLVSQDTCKKEKIPNNYREQ